MNEYWMSACSALQRYAWKIKSTGVQQNSSKSDSFAVVIEMVVGSKLVQQVIYFYCDYYYDLMFWDPVRENAAPTETSSLCYALRIDWYDQSVCVCACLGIETRQV